MKNYQMKFEITHMPLIPKCREWCEACGLIEEGKHTSWICRFLIWIDEKRKFKERKKNGIK